MTINRNGSQPPPLTTYPSRAQCLIELYAMPDPSPIVLEPIGEETADDVRTFAAGLDARIKAGDVWAWAIVVVVLKWRDFAGIAIADHVSASGAEDFAHPDSDAFEQLASQAYAHLVSNIARGIKPHVRDAVSPSQAKE